MVPTHFLMWELFTSNDRQGSACLTTIAQVVMVNLEFSKGQRGERMDKNGGCCHIVP